MAEYIEREAAQTSCRKYSFAESYDAFAVDCILKAIPAADVATVRHGRWIMHDDEFGLTCECSACHIETMGDGNYCPNCGCRMDGGADNG